MKALLRAPYCRGPCPFQYHVYFECAHSVLLILEKHLSVACLVPPPPVRHTPIVTQDPKYVGATRLYTPYPLNRIRNRHPVQTPDVVHVQYHTDEPGRVHSETRVLVEKGRGWSWDDFLFTTGMLRRL
jgi:hypothetical protein